MLVLDIARKMGLSRDAFSRLCAKATGVGFNRTVTRMRLTEACRLLHSTDLAVPDICYRVGFISFSNFNRHFGATTGTTPSHCRRIGQPCRRPVVVVHPAEDVHVVPVIGRLTRRPGD